MAWAFTITDELNSITIHDNSPTVAEGSMYVTYSNINLFAGDTYTEYHEGSDGTRQLIRVRPGDPVLQLTLNIMGNRQDAFNTLTRLRRWIKGPDQQAIRAEMDDNALPVYLIVQPDGVSNATRWRVRSGNLSEETSLVNQFTISGNVAALEVGLVLALHPFGESEEEIELNNIVVNGNFERVNTSNVPYGWTASSGNVSITTTTERALIGQRSAVITNNLNLQDVDGDNATVPANHLMTMTLWVSGIVSSWDFQIQNSGGTSIVGITNITAANVASSAQETRTDRAGNVWYLLKIEQVNLSTASSVHPTIRSSAGNISGSIYVDGVSIMTVEAINLIPVPGMDMPGAAGGALVAGWTVDVTSGGGTGVTGFVIDTSEYFIAPASQEVSIDATATAWRFQSMLFDENQQDQLYTLRLWMKIGSDGGAAARLALRDRNGTLISSIDGISSSTISGLALASATGGDGATWYQLQLTGTNSKGPGVRISFEYYSAGTTTYRFLVDEMYMYRGAGPNFRGVQMFGRHIYNRNDYNDSNPHRVNTVEFFNVPGDVDAVIKLDWYLTKSTVTAGQRAMLSKQVEERYLAVRIDREAEDTGGWWQTGTGGGTWSHVDDAAVSNGRHRRLSTTSAVTNYLMMSVRAHETAAFYAVPRRVLARVRASSLNHRFQLKYKVSAGSVTTENEAVGVQVANTWEIVDLGEIVVYVSPNADGYWFTVGNNIELHVTSPSSVHTADIDTTYFFPAQAGHFVQPVFSQFVATSEWIRFDGYSKEIYRASEGVPTPFTGSIVDSIAHGPRMTRLAFLWTELDGEHIIATASTSALVRARVRPRTTMLLGTV